MVLTHILSMTGVGQGAYCLMMIREQKKPKSKHLLKDRSPMCYSHLLLMSSMQAKQTTFLYRSSQEMNNSMKTAVLI